MTRSMGWTRFKGIGWDHSHGKIDSIGVVSTNSGLIRNHADENPYARIFRPRDPYDLFPRPRPREPPRVLRSPPVAFSSSMVRRSSSVPGGTWHSSKSCKSQPKERTSNLASGVGPVKHRSVMWRLVSQLRFRIRQSPMTLRYSRSNRYKLDCPLKKRTGSLQREAFSSSASKHSKMVGLRFPNFSGRKQGGSTPPPCDVFVQVHSGHVTLT